jgi:hypothetical protein
MSQLVPPPPISKDPMQDRWMNLLWKKVTTLDEVPATAASQGTAGDIAADSSFMYICIAKDTWMRVAIATW